MICMFHPIGWTVLVGLMLATNVMATDGDLRVLLREHFRDPEYRLDRKPEYVVTDPAFIKPVLDQAKIRQDIHTAFGGRTRQGQAQRGDLLPARTFEATGITSAKSAYRGPLRNTQSHSQLHRWTLTQGNRRDRLRLDDRAT